MGVRLVAAGWGFAEATLFFIVPDVFLSRLGIDNPRYALWACGATLGGAVIGGLLMYGLGAADVEGARQALEAVPGVSRSMIARVGDELNRYGMVALFWGPMTGTPYKIYAVEAGVNGMGLYQFALVSVPARLSRFVVVTLIASGGASLLRRVVVRRMLLWLWALLWLGFYTWYFGVVAA